MENLDIILQNYKSIEKMCMTFLVVYAHAPTTEKQQDGVLN